MQKYLLKRISVIQNFGNPIRCHGNKGSDSVCFGLKSAVIKILIIDSKGHCFVTAISALFRNDVQNNIQVQFYKRTISKYIGDTYIHSLLRHISFQIHTLYCCFMQIKIFCRVFILAL